MKEQEYLIYLLVNYCMPTLWNLKPASMINVFKKYRINTVYFYNLMKEVIKVFDCSMIILYENDSMWNVLLYHNATLDAVSHEKENQMFLNFYGYDANKEGIDHLLRTLQSKYSIYQESSREKIRRQNSATEYPHEIGILLGIPVYDVKDFIGYQGKNYLYCGFWKVYHELDFALQTFENYRFVREITMQYMKQGKRLEDIRNFIKKRG